MPALTMNCLCLLHQSLFVSVIPAMQYLYRGALLMCRKIIVQDVYYFLANPVKNPNKQLKNVLQDFQDFR